MIAQMAQSLRGKLTEVSAEAHRELSQQLTASLVDGKTVLFEDAGALGDYTLKRLRPRCRALLEVLLAEDSVLVLESILKRFELAEREKRELRVVNPRLLKFIFAFVSLGGGPGFDAVALLAAMESFREAQLQERTHTVADLRPNTMDPLDGPRPLRCHVLDLAPAWAPALVALRSAATEIWPICAEDFLQLMAPIDLRECDNSQVIEEISTADLVIASYVLHENEAALLKDGLLAGAIPDVFRSVPLGVPLIFLDATHRLWPALVHTAELQGHFSVTIPEGMTSHIHAVVFIREEGVEQRKPDEIYVPCFETFSAHQKANQARLQRLNTKF
ncbi:unnamed protein product [Durusdinium trenchii]|uniref:Uncharacterized protein n=1 Tax=Durusdinium trenchii TaxID=1381693 RepID=A0ABP0NLP0_9DINO